MIVFRAYRKAAWDNINLALNLQVKAEHGAVMFRCVVGQKVEQMLLVPSSCVEGKVNQWNGEAACAEGRLLDAPHLGKEIIGGLI